MEVEIYDLNKKVVGKLELSDAKKIYLEKIISQKMRDHKESKESNVTNSTIIA